VPSAGALNAPFADLGKRLRARPAPPPAPARPAAPPAPPPTPDEPDLFAAAMADVVRLPGGARARVDQPAPTSDGARRLVSEEAEALAVLSDLVTGAGHFDIADTREYV
jgi:hypothetical protein